MSIEWCLFFVLSIANHLTQWLEHNGYLVIIGLSFSLKCWLSLSNYPWECKNKPKTLTSSNCISRRDMVLSHDSRKIGEQHNFSILAFRWHYVMNFIAKCSMAQMISSPHKPKSCLGSLGGLRRADCLSLVFLKMPMPLQHCWKVLLSLFITPVILFLEFIASQVSSIWSISHSQGIWNPKPAQTKLYSLLDLKSNSLTYGRQNIWGKCQWVWSIRVTKLPSLDAHPNIFNPLHYKNYMRNFIRTILLAEF